VLRALVNAFKVPDLRNQILSTDSLLANKCKEGGRATPVGRQKCKM
jgi:hypothetical protein